MAKEKSVLFTTRILNQCLSVNGKKHVYRKNFRKRGFAFEFKQTYLYLSQEIKMVCSQDGWLIPFIAWHISIFSKYHDYFVNSIGDSKWWSFKAWNNVQLVPSKTVFLPRQMSMMSYLNNSLLPSSPSLSKKVVYLPLLHHTCSLKLNAGKVIWPYLQPEFSLELNSSFVNQ